MDENNQVLPKVLDIVPNIISKEEKYKCYYPLVVKCLENIMQGKTTIDFFRKVGAKKIVLYAVNEFSKYLCFDLSHMPEEILISFICDQNADRFPTNVYDQPVYDISHLCKCYKEGKVDKVVLCNLLYEDAIIENLLKEGILLNDMISVSSVLYY